MSSLAAAAMALPPIDKKANSFASNSKKGEWVSRQNQNKHLKNGVSRNHNQNNGFNNNRRKARKQKQDQSMEQVVIRGKARTKTTTMTSVTKGTPMTLSSSIKSPTHSPTKCPMPEFIINELYGTSTTNDIPRSTERMKQMYSSLVSDSESSSCISLESDDCSMPSNEEENINSPLLCRSYNDCMAFPPKPFTPFEIRRLCYENETETHKTLTPNKMTNFISPIESTNHRKEEIDDEVPCRNSCNLSSKNKLDGCGSTYYETIQSKGDNARENENDKESSLQKNLRLKCGQAGRITLLRTHNQEVTPEKDSPISSLQQMARSGNSEGTNYINQLYPRKESSLECLNPYYLSVQDTLETTGNCDNEVVVYGKSPFRSGNRKELGHRLPKDQDDDQRTLITASDTATFISGDVSHSMMTDTGTIQSRTQDCQRTLCLSLPGSLVKNKNTKKERRNEHEIEYELFPLVIGEVEDVANGNNCISPETWDDENLENCEHSQRDSADESSIAETTLVSLASDKVVTSTDVGEEATAIGEVPRDISFCYAKQVEYTSLRDLMGNTQKEASMRMNKDTSLPVNIKSRRGINPIVDVAVLVNEAEQATFHRLGEMNRKHDCDSKDRYVQCEENDKEVVKVGMGTPHTKKLDASSRPKLSLEKINLPEDKEERSNQVSKQETPTAPSSSTFYEEDESVISSNFSVRNDIIIGSIKDLDVFRKERCADDECNFGLLFGKRSNENECNCSIM